jgi:hypothetical protein
MINQIEQLLLEKSVDPCSLFIFPTAVAASRWADRLLLLRGGSIDMEQYIAWDTFKKESIRSRKQGKIAVPDILRKIFTARLIQENAELCKVGKPLFTSLIPARYAENASSFVSWFSALLPQLGAWYEKVFPRGVDDIGALAGDEQDLLSLTLLYGGFLEEQGLFEPAWEKPPFDDTGKDCYIFFPGCLSDFAEYREILEKADHVTLIEPEVDTDKQFYTFFYTNSRSEITEAALYIRHLAEQEHISWENIAVSLPDTGGYDAYVLREFANRNIPVARRSGKALSKYPAGLLFSALAACHSESFSFDSLSALLLNAHLPWKDTEAINQLIDFGIQNNCICSWREGETDFEGSSLAIDVWLDAFASTAGGREKRAEDFYRILKQDITNINKSKTFDEIRKNYFQFRNHFFDMDTCGEESDLVLSRCISELLELIEIEKLFPDITAPDPFSLFSEELQAITYLPRQEHSGVSLLPYRTAAPVPFDCHIILGAAQENLSALFERLPFLSRSRREALGIHDTDASAIFIDLHRYNSLKPAAFFCAEETFTGFAIPHSRLNAPLKARQRYAYPRSADADTADTDTVELPAANFAKDLFRFERDIYEASWNAPPETFSRHADEWQMHSVQAAGFAAWRERRGNAASETAKLSAPLLQELVMKSYREKNGGKIRVSATALKSWYHCPLSWLFERALGIETIRTETTLMAENILGSLYHAILDRFLKSLVDTSDGDIIAGGFSQNDHELLEKSAAAVFAGLPKVPGESRPVSALTARLLRAEEKPVTRQAELTLKKLSAYFAGFRILGSEINQNFIDDDYSLTGKIDCLLEDTRDDSPPGSRVIVDFKLKYLPGREECQASGPDGLEDFQLPMYITLTEKNGGAEVHTALFFSILDMKPRVIFGALTDPVTKNPVPYSPRHRVIRGDPESKFESIIEEFTAKTARYAEDLGAGKFNTGGRESKCYSCKYRRICRTVYVVDRERNFLKQAAE